MTISVRTGNVMEDGVVTSEARGTGDEHHAGGFGGLALDVGAPLVAYYGLHLLGVSDWVALLTASAVAGVRVIWVAVRRRRLTWFATVMLVVFGLGLVLAFVGGDARFLVLKDSFGSAAVGLVFLASLASRTPLTLSAMATWRPSEGAMMTRLYATDPEVRHAVRLSAVVWGIGLLVEAALRVPLVYLLPLDVAFGASTALMVVAISALSVWNAAYASRTRRRLVPAPGSDDPAP